MEKLLEVTEIELHHLATFLKLIIEDIAIFIIAFSVFRAVTKFFRSYRKKDAENFYHKIRLDLG